MSKYIALVLDLVFQKLEWFLGLEKGKDELVLSLIQENLVYTSPTGNSNSGGNEDDGMYDSPADISSDEDLNEDIREELKDLRGFMQTEGVKRRIKALEKLLTGELEKAEPKPPRPPVPDF